MVNYERRNYTAREVMELELEDYRKNGKDVDFKVLAETKNYILTGSVNNDGLIILNIIEGRINGSRLNVSLYLNHDYEGKVNSAQVNWYAIGSVFASEARQNAQQILDASDFADMISGKDFKEYFI